MTLRCVACHLTYERGDCLTFDCGQCDSCITSWAQDKAFRELDAAITADPPTDEHGLREHQRIYKIWHPVERL